MRLNLPSVLGVILLIIGVFAGVVLVQSEQDVRNKASELREHKVVICHKTGSDTNSWNQIEISENAVDSHLAHGDIRGNCPSGEGNSNKDKSDESGNKNGNNNSGGSIGGNVTINNETNNTITETKIETKYVYVNSRVDIWNKLDSLEKKVGNKKFRVIFKSGDELHVFNNVIASADVKGIFKSSIGDTRVGAFDILVKPEGYLQKKFPDQNLLRGINRLHFEDTTLIPGDFDGNNKLDSKDIAELLSFISDNPYPEVDDKKVFDIDSDGDVDSNDLELVLKYYNGLTINGDE